MPNQYLKTLTHSFYSPEAYKNALHNWHGFGLKYFFLVVLICSSITSAKLAFVISKINTSQIADKITSFILSEPDLTFEENINRFFNLLHQIPKMQLHNGEITTDAEQPYSITDPVSKYDVAIIDTTGKYKTLDGTDATLLITKNSVILRDEHSTSKNKEKVVYLRDIDDSYGMGEENVNHILFLLGQIPMFGLKDGRFFTEDNQLYTISDIDGKTIAQIGPGAQIIDNRTKFMLAITEDSLDFKTELSRDITHVEASSINESSFSEFIKLTTAKAKNLIMIGVPVLGIPSLALTSFVFGLFALVFYASLGFVYSHFAYPSRFKFEQILRLTTVAVTPIQIIGSALPHILPSQDILYFLITVGYLYFAIKSVAQR